MAMSRPIGTKKNAFDARNDETFYFTSSGGNIVTKNKIIIRENNAQNRIVYENTTVEGTTAFQQTVPSNTLLNGKSYTFSFVTYDVDNNSSQESLPEQFYCYSRPNVYISNLTEGQTIQTASYNFNIRYEQEQGELLDFLKVYIYSANGVLIKESEELSSTKMPISINYQYNGFENGYSYNVVVKAVTINGQQSQTDKINFRVLYADPTKFTPFRVENKCSDGYNQINTTLKNISGSSIPPNPKFLSYYDGSILKYKLNLIEKTDSVYWNKGIDIPTDFILKIWFELVNIGTIFILGDKSSGNYFEAKWDRKYFTDENDYKDYVGVIGYKNNIETFRIYSNYLNLQNNTSNIMLWFKYNYSNKVYELSLDVVNREDSFAYWNKNNTNIVYKRLTDMNYTEDTNTPTNKKSNLFGNMSDIFNLKKITIYNGVYKHMYITSNIEEKKTTNLPIWDYYTIFDCDFNSNINGGYVDIDSLRSVRIKSREYGELNWITIYDKLVEHGEDINVSFQDYRVPNDTIIEYSLALVDNNGLEESYSETQIVETKWNKIFVSDMSGKTMALNVNVSYSNIDSIGEFGQLQPINSKYPIVIQNGEADYEEGSISGYIVDDRTIDGYARKDIFNSDGNMLLYNKKYLDRKYITDKVNEWKKFLKNGKTKIIKDYNGNCWIAKVNSNVQYSPMSQMSNGLGTISFSFVEQGKWNNEEDLYSNNLIIRN